MLLQLIRLYRRFQMGKYGWHGSYPDWPAANKQVKGYSEDQIVRRVSSSTLQVKNGQAIYERDGLTMDRIAYSWPLLSQLLFTSAKNDNTLHVLDFGGSLGSSYFQNRAYLQHVNLRWDIVEQHNYVQVGLQLHVNDTVHFFLSISDAINTNGKPDLLLLGCVLPYLPDPYAVLKEILDYRIPTIVIDNTYFHDRNGDRLTIQHVPPIYYTASYPAWFLDYEKVKTILSSQYKIREEYLNDQFLYLDGRRINYRGIVADLI